MDSMINNATASGVQSANDYQLVESDAAHFVDPRPPSVASASTGGEDASDSSVKSQGISALSSSHAASLETVSNEEVTTLRQSIRCYERVIVFMGKMGSGKTSNFGAFRGEIGLHKRSLNSQTMGVDEFTFTVEFVDKDGRKTHILFKVYDVEGFTGNIHVDIWILKKALIKLRTGLPKIHVIFYCLSSNRFTNDDRTILNMIVRHSGKELASRLKFILTNTPESPATRELVEEAVQILSKVMKRQVPAEDIVPMDLVDPNIYGVGTAKHNEARGYWGKMQNRMRNLVRNIPDSESFNLDKISIFQEVLSVVEIYWVPVAISLLVMGVLLLVVFLGQFYWTTQLALQTNSELSQELEKLRSTLTSNGTEGSNVSWACQYLRMGCAAPGK